MENIKITKEKYNRAVANHPPGGFVKFVYKYFGKGGIMRNIIDVSFFVVVIASIVFDQLGMMMIRNYILLPYIGIFFGSAVLTLVGHLMNNGRIKKIAKELGIPADKMNYYNDLFNN